MEEAAAEKGRVARMLKTQEQGRELRSPDPGPRSQSGGLHAVPCPAVTGRKGIAHTPAKLRDPQA